MRVKALTSFSTINFSMMQGEVREIVDKDSLSDLLNAKYVEEVKEPKKAVKSSENK